MEEYVSYHKIIQLFQDYQISQEGIGLNSFGHGNVVMFGMTESGMTPTYPFMFVTPQNISYDENIITYTMQLIFADRINDDMSNEIDVISDMDIQARRFMSYIRRGMNQDPPLWNYMDCNLPLTGLPFLERFNDYVGGITIDMEVIIRTDINACDYYVPVSPTPTATTTTTPTPTNTTTPTNTPTNTTTPTVTPTKTGTPTPTPTITPTPTDPRACISYNISNSNFDGRTFPYVDCSGVLTSIFVPAMGTSINFCAKENSIVNVGGTITNLGPCVSPTPTPTNTKTPTTTPIPPTPSPSPCPNISYLCQNGSFSGSLVIQWTDYATGNLLTDTIGPQGSKTVCSKTVPIRISGVNSLTVTAGGTCGC